MFSSFVQKANRYRQWYDVGIATLYEAPHLTGHAYTLFIRTVCPSVIPRIRKSELAGLVKHIDLSTIVHQGSKSTTARLLGRTKASLEIFIAPQASFAINCWASLSKCSRLKILDLSLVSEAISFQSLNQSLRQLSELTHLYLPRCSTHFEHDAPRILWPPRLAHLSLSGSLQGKFLWELSHAPETYPPTLHSLSVLHCPGLDHTSLAPLLENLAATLTAVELRDLPHTRQGKLNRVLDWLPNLTRLAIALDYIDVDFAYRPPTFNASRWRESKPLQALTLLTSGLAEHDPDRAFMAIDLYELVDKRYLGRLRHVSVAQSTGWQGVEEGAELEALGLLLEEVDRESWEKGRWGYEGMKRGWAKYEEWVESGVGRRMRPWVRVLRNR